MKRAPSPMQCQAASVTLAKLAEIERADGDTERARVLAKAAEICEAKAFVGAVASMVNAARKGRRS